jgi:hypothetical protein
LIGTSTKLEYIVKIGKDAIVSNLNCLIMITKRVFQNKAINLIEKTRGKGARQVMLSQNWLLLKKICDMIFGNQLEFFKGEKIDGNAGSVLMFRKIIEVVTNVTNRDCLDFYRSEYMDSAVVETLSVSVFCGGNIRCWTKLARQGLRCF